jgi:hypothetical protein
MNGFISTRRLRWLPVVAAAVSTTLGTASRLRADEPGRVEMTAAEEEALFDSHLVCPPVPCRPNPCPPNPCAPGVMPPDQVFQPSPSPLTQPSQPAQQPSFANQPNVASLSAGQGALTGQDYVPAIVGDFFAGPGTIIDSDGGGVVSIPRGNSVGIMKFAENGSPIPRDRFFVNYSYFDDVNLIPGKLDVRRLAPGFEKTMFDGTMSLELRVPMATTLNSTTPFDANSLVVSGYDTTSTELGNVTGFFKALLYQNDVWALSTGLGIALPTADDLRVINDDGSGVVFNRIKNEAVHLLPFIGATFTPNDRFFMQGVLQFDAGLNGNSVYAYDTSTDELFREGKLDDPNFVFVSLSGGYWIYQAADPSSLLSRIALIGELHTNNTLNRTDSIQGFSGDFSDSVNIQTINAVVGTNVIIDQNKSLILGYVAPIGGGRDRAFDGEFRLLFNWYFGPALNRQTRAQF